MNIDKKEEWESMTYEFLSGYHKTVYDKDR